MGMFGRQLLEEPIYQTSYMGVWIKVYPNRVDFKDGLGSRSIPINQIASIQLAMRGVFQITLETTGGKKYSIPTSRKKEVQQAVYDALARSTESNKQQTASAGEMSEQWEQQASSTSEQLQPMSSQQQSEQQLSSSPAHIWPQQQSLKSYWQQLLGPQPLRPQFQNKRNNPWFTIGILVIGVIVCGVLFNVMTTASNVGNKTANSSITPGNTSSKVTQVVQSAISPTTVPTPTPTPSPTPSPTPTPTAAQIEAQYKASTTSTTVTNLDKDGTADKGKDVHFTCTIVNFVKDSTGATAGANVSDPGSYSGSVVQILFPSGTNITRLNQDDTLEVWGNDAGVFSGTNAFGGTVQEVGIVVFYLTDQTTNYQAGS